MFLEIFSSTHSFILELGTLDQREEATSSQDGMLVDSGYKSATLSSLSLLELEKLE